MCGVNNVGFYQYLEKVVLLFFINVILGELLFVYGDGQQMCDYVYVYDYCIGIEMVLFRGNIGEVYNVGIGCEMINLEMVDIVLEILGKDYSFVKYVIDCFGYDCCYFMNVDKLWSLGWQFKYDFKQVVVEVVRWYEGNCWWWELICSGEFCEYYNWQYVGCFVSVEFVVV